jgi:hypothetical protein
MKRGLPYEPPPAPPRKTKEEQEIEFIELLTGHRPPPLEPLEHCAAMWCIAPDTVQPIQH